jgi:hypothetical protein
VPIIAEEGIVSTSPVDDIIASAAKNHVGAMIAGNLVSLWSAIDGVVSEAATYSVPSAQSKNKVMIWCADNPIVTGGSRNRGHQ